VTARGAPPCDRSLSIVLNVSIYGKLQLTSVFKRARSVSGIRAWPLQDACGGRRRHIFLVIVAAVLRRYYLYHIMPGTTTRSGGLYDTGMCQSPVLYNMLHQ